MRIFFFFYIFVVKSLLSHLWGIDTRSFFLRRQDVFAHAICKYNNVYFSPQQTVFIEGGRQKLIASVRWQHCRRYIGHVYNGGSDDYCEFDLIIMINVVTQWTLFEIVVDFVCFEKKITSEFLYAFSISL